jgi:hypothetical protein
VELPDRGCCGRPHPASLQDFPEGVAVTAVRTLPQKFYFLTHPVPRFYSATMLHPRACVQFLNPNGKLVSGSPHL